VKKQGRGTGEQEARGGHRGENDGSTRGEGWKQRGEGRESRGRGETKGEKMEMGTQGEA